MSLINFSDIDFNTLSVSDVNSFDFNGSKINIIKCLSTQDKYNLIVNTLNKSDEGELFNSFKTKFYFELNLVMAYSNIVFSTEDLSDEVKLYDILKKSGLMDKIIATISNEEKETLWKDIISAQESMLKYRNSISYFVGDLLEKVPGLLDQLKVILSNLDDNQIQSLVGAIVNAKSNKDSN